MKIVADAWQIQNFAFWNFLKIKKIFHPQLVESVGAKPMANCTWISYFAKNQVLSKSSCLYIQTAKTNRTFVWNLDSTCHSYRRKAGAGSNETFIDSKQEKDYNTFLPLCLNTPLFQNLIQTKTLANYQRPDFPMVTTVVSGGTGCGALSDTTCIGARALCAEWCSICT